MINVSVSATPSAGRLVVTARMLGNETSKGLRLLWHRTGLLITAMFASAVLFLIFRFFVEGGHISREMVELTLPALVGLILAQYTAIAGSGGIAEEVNGGTLEQTQLSPARPALLIVGRLSALAVEGLIGAVVLGVIFGLAYQVHYTVRPDVLVPILLTMLDGLGYALLITALTLWITSVGALTHVYNMTIMIFNGLFIPVHVFPQIVVIFARFVPTTLGVEVLNTTLQGRGLGTAWSDHTLPWLLVHIVVSGGLGWFIYLRTMRRALREGGLGPR